MSTLPLFRTTLQRRPNALTPVSTYVTHTRVSMTCSSTVACARQQDRSNRKHMKLHVSRLCQNRTASHSQQRNVGGDEFVLQFTVHFHL